MPVEDIYSGFNEYHYKGKSEDVKFVENNTRKDGHYSDR